MMYVGKTEDGSHLLVSRSPIALRLSILVLLQRSAQYLRKDLPIRFAHRIDDFRNLPFVVACNPLLLELVRTHIAAAHAQLDSRSARAIHQNLPHASLVSAGKRSLRARCTRTITCLLKIKTLDQEKAFTELLENTLNCSSDTLPLLAEGFRESKRHIKVSTSLAARHRTHRCLSLSLSS